ncbi:hypothetical protein Pfo_001897 [Paulownia fortunei]|nr:hypothetical protein Pfo_001897 [Paulownia fortunei]
MSNLTVDPHPNPDVTESERSLLSNSHMVGASTPHPLSEANLAIEMRQPNYPISHQSCPKKEKRTASGKASKAPQPNIQDLFKSNYAEQKYSFYYHFSTPFEIQSSFKSKAFLMKLGPTALEYNHYGFKSAREHAQAQGFIGELDAKGPLHTVSPIKRWEGNPNEDLSRPKWESTSEAVIQLIQEARASSSAHKGQKPPPPIICQPKFK